MGMTNFTLGAGTGNRIFQNVNVQLLILPTMASQPVRGTMNRVSSRRKFGSIAADVKTQ